jgi:dynein heavy chain
MGLVGIQMLWTSHTENAIKNSTIVKKIMRDTNNHFIKILNMLIDCTTKNLTKMERLKYESLITIHVHQRFELVKFTCRISKIIY